MVMGVWPETLEPPTVNSALLVPLVAIPDSTNVNAQVSAQAKAKILMMISPEFQFQALQRPSAELRSSVIKHSSQNNCTFRVNL
jgi:hypothetical protein